MLKVMIVLQCLCLLGFLLGIGVLVNAFYMGDDPIPQNDPDKASRHLYIFFGSFIIGPLLILGSGALSIILGFAGMMGSLAKRTTGENERTGD